MQQMQVIAVTFNSDDLVCGAVSCSALAPASAKPTSPSSSDSESSSTSSSSESSKAIGISRSRPVPIDSALMYEEHGTEGEKGSYKRWRLKCPHAATGHWHVRHVCCHSRNIGPRQCTNFGALEPQAFLLVWASKAADYASRKKHMSYTPTKADIGNFLRSRSLL